MIVERSWAGIPRHALAHLSAARSALSKSVFPPRTTFPMRSPVAGLMTARVSSSSPSTHSFPISNCVSTQGVVRVRPDVTARRCPRANGGDGAQWPGARREPQERRQPSRPAVPVAALPCLIAGRTLAAQNALRKTRSPAQTPPARLQQEMTAVWIRTRMHHERKSRRSGACLTLS